MAERCVRVVKPGSAVRSVRKSELADAIASGWTPVWDQSIETLATQVGVLRDAVVDIAGGPVDEPLTRERVEALIEERLDARLANQPAPPDPRN